MNARRMPRLLAGFLLAFLGAGLCLLNGSAPPTGEVFPYVIPFEDRFEVYFEDTRESGSEGKAIYRSALSLDGKETEHRQRFRGEIPVRMSLKMQLLNGPDGVPSWEIGFEGGSEDKPRFGGESKVHRFQVPPGHNEDCVVLGWPVQSKMLVRYSEAHPASPDEWPFYLGLFETRTGSLIKSARIGKPTRDIEIANTSRVTESAEEYLIAWIEDRLLERKVENWPSGPATVESHASRVVLTRWNPNKGKALHFNVGPTTGRNVAVDVAANRSHAMVAWHDYGKVRTRVIELSSKNFTETLPVLEDDADAVTGILRGKR